MSTGLEGVLLIVGRLLFGGVLAYTGIGHFTGTEGMAQYAEYKGLPAPKLSVLASGVLLVACGLGVIVGVFPAIAAIVLAVFLVVSAVLMHDFWNVDEEQRQSEVNNFQKNVAMAGGALILASVATNEWALGLGVGLF